MPSNSNCKNVLIVGPAHFSFTICFAPHTNTTHTLRRPQRIARYIFVDFAPVPFEGDNQGLFENKKSLFISLQINQIMKKQLQKMLALPRCSSIFSLHSIPRDPLPKQFTSGSYISNCRGILPRYYLYWGEFKKYCEVSILVSSQHFCQMLHNIFLLSIAYSCTVIKLALAGHKTTKNITEGTFHRIFTATS